MDNILIEASAGAGKTHRLAERLVELLSSDCIRPEEIVALTFSRAAASEIFERFIGMLVQRARLESRYVKYLRDVISSQHLSQIGTIDSFLMKIARVYPYEVGLGGNIEILDGFQEKYERSRVSFSILHRTDEKSRRDFTEAFFLVEGDKDVRSFIGKYDDFVRKWHKCCLANASMLKWGNIDSFPLLSKLSSAVTRETLEEASEKILCSIDEKAKEKLLNFSEFVKNFRGTFDLKKLNVLGKQILENVNPFTGEGFESLSTRDAKYVTDPLRKPICDALCCVYAYALKRLFQKSHAIYRLISEYEKQYDKTVRSQGRLVFGDIPRLISRLDNAVRLGLEFRIDCAIKAWALDEFQDTSTDQWQAISNLIDESKQSSDGKSVFIVGDVKQAIYGWRDGDISIFNNEKKSGSYKVEPLTKSFRSCEPIIDTINKIFVFGEMKSKFPQWECSEHFFNKDFPGLVQIEYVSDKNKDAFIDPIYNAIKALDPVSKGIEAAILVRTNTFGKFLQLELNRRGLKDVVFDGEINVLSTPALFGFLDLVTLADHPGDKLVWNHFRHTLLSRLLYGENIPDVKKVSGEFSQSFSEKGLSRTFRAIRERIDSAGEEKLEWTDFIESQYMEMLRCAEEFEIKRGTGSRLSDFNEFLKEKTRNLKAPASKVRIMTIHKSKGLGFDHVILPVYEKDGIDTPGKHSLVADDFVLTDVEKTLARHIEGLSKLWNDAQRKVEMEELCAYYVAMTRAKSAMTVMLPPKPKNPTSIKFSTLVEDAGFDIPYEYGDKNWADKFVQAKRENIPDSDKGIEEKTPDYVRGRREFVRRFIPSKKFVSGQSASVLFMQENNRKSAIERGITEHKNFERIEFLDESLARTQFEKCLVKPTGFKRLWREKSYEVFENGIWESGQFDRVVFTEDGATIYDFKTNRMLRGETPADFGNRMKNMYLSQMASYRRSLSILSKIEPEKIRTVLLLVESATAVEV